MPRGRARARDPSYRILHCQQSCGPRSPTHGQMTRPQVADVRGCPLDVDLMIVAVYEPTCVRGMICICVSDWGDLVSVTDRSIRSVARPHLSLNAMRSGVSFTIRNPLSALTSQNGQPGFIPVGRRRSASSAGRFASGFGVVVRSAGDAKHDRNEGMRVAREREKRRCGFRTRAVTVRLGLLYQVRVDSRTVWSVGLFPACRRRA